MSVQPYPIKETPVDHEILDVIKNRWSPVAFSDQPIEPEKINSLFEAARWTMSSRNEQPLRFIYATKADGKSFEKIAGLLTEDNAYAKNAYLLMVVCAMKNFVYKNKPNPVYLYDTGAAAGYLFLQAVALGLIGHEMRGFDREAAYEKLNIPANQVEAVTMMAVGYPGELDNELIIEEKRQDHLAERARKPISEIAFRGAWPS